MAMTLRLTEDEAEMLRAAAAREGVSMHEFARRAIREYAEQWGRQRDAFLADFVGDNKGLLDRLAQ